MMIITVTNLLITKQFVSFISIKTFSLTFSNVYKIFLQHSYSEKYILLITENFLE